MCTSSTVSDDGDLIQTNTYDGRNYRILRTTTADASTGAETRHFYYSAGWQSLEERLGASTDPERQYVWGLRYIDDCVLRDRDADGTLDERFYPTQDANWNITALVDDSGSVQERYAYSAYGVPTFLTSAFGSRASSNYDWQTLFASYRQDPALDLYAVRYRTYHPELGVWLQRDPVGYQDGQNLYRAYFVPGRTDAFGLASVVLDADAFIPYSWVQIPPDPRAIARAELSLAIVWLTQSYVKGDNRGFSNVPLRNRKTRQFQYIGVDTCACCAAHGPVTHKGGRSNESTRKDVLFWPLGSSGEYFTTDQGGFSHSESAKVVTNVRKGGDNCCTIDITMSAEGNSPFKVTGLAAFLSIDWKYSIRIRHCGTRLTWRVLGKHDGFPAHEFYVRVDGAVADTHFFAPPGTSWGGSPARLSGYYAQQNPSLSGSATVAKCK